MGRIEFRFVRRIPQFRGSHDYPVGLTTYPRSVGLQARVWIDLGIHYQEMRSLHRGIDWFVAELNRTVDHEVVHAMLPESKHPQKEERLARRFEKVSGIVRNRL